MLFLLTFLIVRIKLKTVLWYLAHLNKLTYLLHFFLLALLLVPRGHDKLLLIFGSYLVVIELFLKFQVLLWVNEIAKISTELLKIDVFVYLELLILATLSNLFLLFILPVSKSFRLVKLTISNVVIHLWVIFLNETPSLTVDHVRWSLHYNFGVEC